MRDFHLRFCALKHGWPEPFQSQPLDLLDDATLDELPRTEGVYIIGTGDGTMLVYPWGTSPVFYIGRSDQLRRRLRSHRKHTCSAIADHDDRWWPRYQYGASFGAHVAYYERKDSKAFEAEIVTDFFYAFGSIPAANSAWPRDIKPVQE